MSWIKMTTGLARAPEVISISLSTGLDEFSIIGRLHAIWCWLDEQTEDGKLSGVSMAIVDRIVNFPGFGAAMEKAGWLCEEDGILIAPNFGKHNGSTAKQRANSGARMGRLRTRRNGSVTEANESDAPGVPRGEERRVEKKSTETKRVLKSSSSSSAQQDGEQVADGRGRGGLFELVPEEEKPILKAIAKLFKRPVAALNEKEHAGWINGRPEEDPELTLEDVALCARWMSEERRHEKPHQLHIFLSQRQEQLERARRWMDRISSKPKAVK